MNVARWVHGDLKVSPGNEALQVLQDREVKRASKDLKVPLASPEKAAQTVRMAQTGLPGHKVRPVRRVNKALLALVVLRDLQAHPARMARRLLG